MHERSLHVDADQHAEPDQVDAHLLRHRREQWNNDEGDLEVVEKEGKEKYEHVDEDKKADDATGQVEKHALDPQIAVDSAEREAENGRPDQNEHHHRGQFQRGIHALLEQIPGQAPMHDRKRERADRAHRAALGRCRKPDKNRAEHHEDQHQRRHHRHHAAHEQHAHTRGAHLLGQRRHFFRPDDADYENPDAKQRHQDEAWNESAGIHVADGTAHGIGKHDEHQRGRDDLGDRA